MTTDAPPRSLDQRMEALARANDIRSRRAQLKRDIKAGRKRALMIVLDPPEWTLTMRVSELLMAEAKVGRVKVNRILNTVRMSPSKTVGGLSERQRAELANHLRKSRSTGSSAGSPGVPTQREPAFA